MWEQFAGPMTVLHVRSGWVLTSIFQPIPCVLVGEVDLKAKKEGEGERGNGGQRYTAL
jgi:hypothetical protein